MGIANIINNSTTTSGGEIVRELVNASDGAGLHLTDTGQVTWPTPVATDFGLSDFSVEFILNQTEENTNGNYIYFSHTSGNNRFYLHNDKGANDIAVIFANSSGSSTGLDFTLPYDMSADYGTPTHYVFTFDRDGDVTLYKNGNSVASVSINAASAINLGDGNANVGRIGSSSSYGVLGTFYRFRAWNKLVDAKALFERADVDFADQYGSASNQVTNGNFETNTSGWTSENTSTFQRNTTAPISGTGDLEWTGDGSGYPGAISNAFTLTAGKKYRIKFTYRVTSGTVYLKFGKTAGATSAAVAGISEATLNASSNTEYEAVVTPTESTTAYIVFRGNNNTTPSMFVDLVDFVQIGALVDLDLAFASPTQSLMVQDRSTNNVDGTASSSTAVSQVQKVVQLNSEELRVAGSAPKIGVGLANAVTPAGKLHVHGADGDGYLRLSTDTTGATATDGARIGYNGSNLRIQNFENSNVQIFTNNTTEAMTISSAGDITSTNATGSKPILTLENTTNDANSSQLLFKKNRTATNNDNLGTLRFRGNNNAGSPEVIEYATIYAQSTNVADGAEDGQMIFRTMKDGTLGARLTINSDGAINIPNLSASSDVQTDGSKNLITSSDKRLKNDIGELTAGLDIISNLEPRYFSWKNDESNTQQLGFYAQDVYEFLPEAAPREQKQNLVTPAVAAEPATYYEEGDELPEGKAVGDEKTAAVEAVEAVFELATNEDGTPDYNWGFNGRPIIAALVAAVKELKSKVETLENA